LDLTDVTNVTSNLIVQPKKEFSSFNLMSQILPSKEPFPDGQHFNTQALDFGSLEFKIIANLFNRTFTHG